MPEGVPVQVTSVRDLLEKVQQALQKGSGVRSSDVPDRKLLGYQVFEGDVAAQYLHIGLTQVKESNQPSTLGGFGVKPEILAESLHHPGGGWPSSTCSAG